jgi:hypothetical protein
MTDGLYDRDKLFETKKLHLDHPVVAASVARLAPKETVLEQAKKDLDEQDWAIRRVRNEHSRVIAEMMERRAALAAVVERLTEANNAVH